MREANSKGNGIFINFRHSNWSAVNFIWDWSKEEQQKREIDSKKENKTWEVDKWDPKQKSSCNIC